MHIKKKHNDGMVVLCMAMMENKDYKRCIELAAPVAQKAVVIGADMPRCCPPEKLAEVFSRQRVEAAVVPACMEAVQTAIGMAGSQGVVCVCGSLYLAGKVRKAMGG